MKTNENAHLVLLKVLGVSILVFFCLSLVVRGGNIQLSSVTIEFSNDSEIHVLTSKTKISDILEENHIILLPDEKVTPALDNDIDNSKKIKISKLSEVVNEVSEESEKMSLETLSQNYSDIVEKLITIEEEIPYETIEKDISNNSSSTTNKVLQNGVNGIREVTYRVKYRNDEEIEREEVSSKVIKEPVNKIVQVISRQTTTSRSSVARNSASTLAQKVANIEPTVKTMNVSAYTASTCDKLPSDPGYGRTASGAMVSEWYTVAAGKGYKMGTIIYIPYFANKPNGGWFVVQDRGGAISNSRLDIYMGTYSECIQFGRRNLECYIYEV